MSGEFRQPVSEDFAKGDMTTPSEIERGIVEAARTSLSTLRRADSKTLNAAVAGAGFALQPFDLDYVLALHPQEFWKDWAGVWTLLPSSYAR